ncbi:hypothetical protein B0A55_08180 [Friedmanniomyces simplex]|uniref:Metaxin glutathione S-transferase domain-containing protein n=1 Tax=Friedmanniomyces simplex TaxID=329884 RepID=A0A4U0WVV0_9PEZI|nr:hypothetical protein B0A55_08180 [Friedmanniomyces simplex]
MPDDDPPESQSIDDDEPSPQPTKVPAKSKPSVFDSLFAIPSPLKHIFDRVPLITYTANELPLRSPRDGRKNILHLFTTPEDAKTGRPSFNPACLKWQVYLKFTGMPFTTVPSTNHASPPGALPFLQPGVSASEPSKQQQPVPSNKLKRWIATQKPGEKAQEPPDDMRYEAFTSLIDHRIRRAWQRPTPATPLHRPLLSNTFVQLTIAHKLRRAAEMEILKSNPSSTPSTTIIEADIFRDAEEALEALSTLLEKEDEWFFGQEKPALFDASVFAYTELLLDEGVGWRENNRLGEMVKKHENLVKHRERVKKMYF